MPWRGSEGQREVKGYSTNLLPEGLWENTTERTHATYQALFIYICKNTIILHKQTVLMSMSLFLFQCYGERRSLSSMLIPPFLRPPTHLTQAENKHVPESSDTTYLHTVMSFHGWDASVVLERLGLQTAVGLDGERVATRKGRDSQHNPNEAFSYHKKNKCIGWIG